MSPVPLAARQRGVGDTRRPPVLVRLDAAGFIGLPPARRAQGRPHPPALEMAGGLVGPAAPEAAAPGRVGATLLVRPIRSEEQCGWRAHMQRFHYLGDAALVGESLRYAASLDGEWVALLSWGAAALHNGPRDRYLGWDEATKRTTLHLVVNNARFLILPWIRQPHLASRVLGRTLRRLSRDWEHAYGHPVVLAETFVDPSRFRGSCYRASNWRWVGGNHGLGEARPHVSLPRPAQGGVAVSAAPRLQRAPLQPRARAPERGGADGARCGEASP